MLYRRDRETGRLVRDILAQMLPESILLDGVGERLHLSSRTLHRRLRGEGSSFRVLKDALRRDIVLTTIENKRQPIAQLAANLGYSEPSAFFRAFRKWTGEAPTGYRRRNAG
jgi:AraC-like DNA-binding protein